MSYYYTPCKKSLSRCLVGTFDILESQQKVSTEPCLLQASPDPKSFGLSIGEVFFPCTPTQYSVLRSHQILQAQFALSEVMLVSHITCLFSIALAILLCMARSAAQAVFCPSWLQSSCNVSEQPQPLHKHSKGPACLSNTKSGVCRASVCRWEQWLVCFTISSSSRYLDH